MSGDHPVSSHDTLERDQVVLVLVVLFTRREGRHMDVAAVVVKPRSPRGRRQPFARRIIKVERLSDRRCTLGVTSVDINPQKLRTLQPFRPTRQIIKTLDLRPVEQNRIDVLLLLHAARRTRTVPKPCCYAEESSVLAGCSGVRRVYVESLRLPRSVFCFRFPFSFCVMDERHQRNSSATVRSREAISAAICWRRGSRSGAL